MWGTAMAANSKLGAAEYKATSAFLRALDVFTNVRNTLPTQYVRAFLFVAMDEGKTIGEYAQKSGVSTSVMSRHILDLSDSSRRAEEGGMDLVYTKMNPLNRREHLVFLTPKGKALLNAVVRNLEH